MASNGRHDQTIPSLGRYWDEVVQGRPADPGNLDPALAAMVRQLYARDDALGADPAFAARLLADLEDQMLTTHPALTPHGGLPPHAGATRATERRAPAGPVWSSWPPGGTSRSSWRPLAHLASAALVIVTLATAYLALGLPRTPWPSGQPSTLPALVAPATPASAEQDSRTLVAITVPAGTVPSEIVAGLNHYTIPAGTSSSTAATWVSTCCTGPRLDYVLSGSFTLRAEGPVQLLRAGLSRWETIAAETELTLNAGDAVLLRMEDAFAATNANATPVELVEGGLIGGVVNDGPIPQGWVYHDEDIMRSLLPAPFGPMTVRLQEATLAPGAELPLPPGAVLQLAVTRDTRATLGDRGDFAKRNLGNAPVALYVLTLEPAPAGAPAPGTPSP